MKNIINEKPISINGDGKTTRDYIHVSDLADIHLEVAKYLLEKSKSNLFKSSIVTIYSTRFFTKMEKESSRPVGPELPHK